MYTRPDGSLLSEDLKAVAAASIQLRLSRQLSGTLIVACRSTPSQPCDDFHEFLPLLETMLEFHLAGHSKIHEPPAYPCRIDRALIAHRLCRAGVRITSVGNSRNSSLDKEIFTEALAALAGGLKRTGQGGPEGYPVRRRETRPGPSRGACVARWQ